jgi:hypothetical protein
MTGQETRNKLTDYWKDNDVKKEMNLHLPSPIGEGG